jgi:hypothetical protein
VVHETNSPIDGNGGQASDRAALENDITEFGEKSRFLKVADDEYALISWATKL